MSSNRTIPSLVLAVGVGLWAPSMASAQWSSFWPSLERCQEDGYLTSSSSFFRSYCQGLFEDELSDRHDAGERDGTVVSEQVAQLDSSFSAVPTAVEAIRLDPIEASSAGGLRSSERDVEHFWYVYDGAEIDSCDEYVWQRFYEYEQLMRAASRSDSARAVFDAAYGTGDAAIGARGLAGVTIPAHGMSTSFSADQAKLLLPVLPATWEGIAGYGPDLGVNVVELPKNDYFALSDEELAMVRGRSYGIWLRLRDGRRYYRMSTYRGGNPAPNPWQWHRMMSDAQRAAGLADAELQIQAERRRDFRRLLAHRRSLRASGHSTGSPQVTAVNLAIVDALREANTEGCLSWSSSAQNPDAGRYDIGHCDWAPEDFVQSITRTFEAQERIHQSLCERHTPASFTSLAGGYDYYACSNLGTCGRHTSVDPRRSESYMNTFLQRAHASQGYVVSAFTEGGQAPVLHFDEGDTYQWGDSDLVSATFAYWANGGVVDDAWGGGEVDACDVNPNLDAGARLSGAVFDRTVDIAEASVQLDVRRNERQLTLAVFGTDYYEGGWEHTRNASRGQLDYTRSGGDSASESWDRSYSQRFFIGPVPVSLTARLVATVGLQASWEIDVSERYTSRDYYGNVHCDIDGAVAASIEPYVDVSLHGSAGIDAVLFGGGIEADVLLANVGLPVTVSVGVADGPSGLELHGDTDANLHLTSLSGRIGGYVEAIGERYSATFLAWPAAFDETLSLYSNDFDFAFSELAICANPRVSCGR